MNERHTLKSLPGISHSGGPVLWVELSIRSVITAISPFVDKLMLLIKRCRCAKGSEIDVEVSLREALANAVVHGNHEGPDKHVYVVCRCTPDGEVSIVVRDEGAGFNSAELPNPTAADQLQSTHGRGIYCLNSQ